MARLCTSVLSRSGKVGSAERIRIQGCTADLYLYQAVAIFVMMEMEMFQKGGFNADDMGLGKVRICAHPPCSESSSSFLPPSFLTRMEPADH